MSSEQFILNFYPIWISFVCRWVCVLWTHEQLNSHQVLLDAGYDPNYMLHPWVRRNYDDERRSALFFAVSNNDIPSARLLLEGGAMANQDPIKCLQVSVMQHKDIQT